MDIINKLTLKQLLTNKKRTLVTIMGIIISVAMFTAVTTFVTSFMKMMMLDVASYEGNWHVCYNDLDNSQIASLQNDDNYHDGVIYQDIDTLLIDQNQPLFASLNQLDNYQDNVELVKGTYPTNQNEIIISKYYQNSQLEIGDEISVKANAGDLADQYLQSEPMSTSDSLPIKTFKIVGIYQPNYLNQNSYFDCFYTAKHTNSKTTRLYITLNHVDKDIFEDSIATGKTIGVTSSNITYHHNLLYYYGISNNDNFNQTMYTVIGIVMIIIMIGSIGLIYNAFAISLNERSRYLGILSSIGATKKQKKQSVYFEGMIVGSIAIVLGVIAGIGGMAVTFSVINPILKSLGETTGFPLTISFTGILVAVIFAIITIFISSIIPARHASKISPIAAINNQQDIKIKKRNVKTSFITKKIFGFEGDLAMKNIKRNKNRYRITLISLIISSILFLTASGFTYYLKKSYDMTSSNVNYDGFIDVSSTSDELINELANLKNVSELAVSKQTYINLETNLNNINSDLIHFLEENNQILNNPFYLDFMIITYNQDYLNKNSDLNKLLDQHYLVNKTNNVKLNRKFKQTSILKEGLTNISGTSYDSEANLIDVTFDNLVFIDEYLLGQKPSENYDSLYLLVSNNNFEKLCSQYHLKNHTTIYYTSDNNEAVTKEINEIIEKYPEASAYNYNQGEELKQINQTILIINIFTYGFIVLIGLISIANIVNTISTSMALRTKEFSMLKSIGMTPRAFNKMIYFESLFYGIKTLIYSIPIGLFIMYLLYHNLTNVFDQPFTIPLNSFIILTIIIFIIVFTTLSFSSRKIKKLTIIDGLKNDNI